MDKGYNRGVNVLNPNTIGNRLGQSCNLMGHFVGLSTYEWEHTRMKQHTIGPYTLNEISQIVPRVWIAIINFVHQLGAIAFKLHSKEATIDRRFDC
jgi:hypothetical protein